MRTRLALLIALAWSTLLPAGAHPASTAEDAMPQTGVQAPPVRKETVSPADMQTVPTEEDGGVRSTPAEEEAGRQVEARTAPMAGNTVGQREARTTLTEEAGRQTETRTVLTEEEEEEARQGETQTILTAEEAGRQTGGQLSPEAGGARAQTTFTAEDTVEQREARTTLTAEEAGRQTETRTVLTEEEAGRQGETQTMLTAEEAAGQVGALISASDYTALAALLPAVRDVLPAPLATLSDALVAYHYGRPAESNQAIDRLADGGEEALGPDVMLGMQALRVYNCHMLNDYAGASRTIRLIVDRLPDEDVQSRYSFEAFGRWMEAFASWPPTTLRRPEGACILPVEIRPVGRGEHLWVEVCMNGRTEPFIFDTGCSGSNFLTQSAADRLGVRILADSIPVTGIVTSCARVGVADSLRIGPILVLHPTFIVAPDSTAGLDADGLAQAVLGTDIIRALGEVRIEPARRRIVLPAAPSEAPARPNLCFDGGQYHLLCTQDGQPLRLLFDTGNVKSNFSARYYDRFRHAVRARGKRGTSMLGGFGGVRKLKVRTLPEITLRCGQCPVTLHRITVTTRGKDMEAQHDLVDGSIGMDFVTACNALTFDLQRMFVRPQ